MIEQYWGLTENPFKNTLDSRFFYISKAHQQALEMFNFVIKEHMGVAILTGLLGTGKTFLANELLERLKNNYKFCVVSHPKLSPQELLFEIAYQLGLKDKLSNNKVELIHSLKDALINNLSDGKETIVVIDEAQAIEDIGTFEEIRLLLNLCSNESPLFSLFLLGHSQLEDKVSTNKALSQRIAVKFHLDRLNEEEAKNYINHRLDVAGKTKEVFNAEAIKLIFELSAGIPRKINNLCGMALFSGAQKRLEIIDEATVREVNNLLVV